MHSNLLHLETTAIPSTWQSGPGGSETSAERPFHLDGKHFPYPSGRLCAEAPLLDAGRPASALSSRGGDGAGRDGTSAYST